MNVLILGYTGFIGSAIFVNVQEKYTCVGMRSIDAPLANRFDVVINCAGFSRVYAAENDPADMRKSEEAIFEKIKLLTFDKLIHISTSHIDSHPKSKYSMIKLEIENRLRNLCANSLSILRVSGVIGKGLKKNVVFDLLHDLDLFVTRESTYNYITTSEVANIVRCIIDNDIAGIINIGAVNSISVHNIARLFGKIPTYGTRTEAINIDTSLLQGFYSVASSEYYLNEYRKSLENLKDENSTSYVV